ncbi:HAMP domain-containing sensor histidine kinase [Pseudarthrobacter sp. PS3-L1]|uniref:sensor histidine kinase n=1 Tax=Pseudarthrobacter sp. PS3-L1 TaxID=3046207 RepID=UPI0024BBCA7B|nr:HAMP domain-containing sensor histidine kinase [Pseudarthrobacter sp. PS3-L1]MDJ0321929.1 HAMP domain-containing sensor histidine kinase [Pseudarthrobacter sp. PS3-L1]
MSVRLKLTLSYVGFLMVAGGLLLTVVWVFLLRYVPAGAIDSPLGFVPNRSDLQRAFGPAAVTVLAVLLIFGFLGGWLLAGRMLAPLSRITSATRIAARGSLSHRIRLEGRRDEFRELADSFDAMLEQLEVQVAEQQRFAANASHELRTPLAITQALLNVAANDPHRDATELIARLGTVNARAIDLTEALLLLTRADQKTFAREQVDLSLLVEEAIETLFPLAEKRGVAIKTAITFTPTFGSHPLLLHMVTNLLHNAIVHNIPLHGVMWLSTTNSADTTTLIVENTGEIVTEKLAATLTERFRRGSDRTRTGDHPGVGLGLAIVKSIAHAHNGTLTLSPRPAGGLRIKIHLPTATGTPGDRKRTAP